jgi:hypothetical protein
VNLISPRPGAALFFSDGAAIAGAAMMGAGALPGLAGDRTSKSMRRIPGLSDCQQVKSCSP